MHSERSVLEMQNNARKTQPDWHVFDTRRRLWARSVRGPLCHPPRRVTGRIAWRAELMPSESERASGFCSHRRPCCRPSIPALARTTRAQEPMRRSSRSASRRPSGVSPCQLTSACRERSTAGGWPSRQGVPARAAHHLHDRLRDRAAEQTRTRKAAHEGRGSTAHVGCIV
jgi:hypothetical protein